MTLMLFTFEFEFGFENQFLLLINGNGNAIQFIRICGAKFLTINGLNEYYALYYLLSLISILLDHPRA